MTDDRKRDENPGKGSPEGKGPPDDHPRPVKPHRSSSGPVQSQRKID